MRAGRRFLPALIGLLGSIRKCERRIHLSVLALRLATDVIMREIQALDSYLYAVSMSHGR